MNDDQDEDKKKGMGRLKMEEEMEVVVVVLREREERKGVWRLGGGNERLRAACHFALGTDLAGKVKSHQEGQGKCSSTLRCTVFGIQFQKRLFVLMTGSLGSFFIFLSSFDFLLFSFIN